MKKEIGLIGLGKMGYNMALNLLSKKYKIVAYDRTSEKVKKIEKKGAVGAYSLRELCEKLEKQRIILMMISAGKPVDEVTNTLSQFLGKDDILIDGGNSFYEDSEKKYKNLKREGIHFIDMGTSGGLEGARNGVSLTIGGDKKIFKKIEFLFNDLSIKDGYSYIGKSGSGHLVKMIHNSIEYALLEAYGEGFEILSKSKYKLDLHKIASTWCHGSIIESYLLKLIEKILKENPKLRGTDGIIGGGETGKMAYSYAKKINFDFKVLEHALKKRNLSEKERSFSSRLISLVRHEFGGHALTKDK